MKNLTLVFWLIGAVLLSPLISNATSATSYELGGTTHYSFSDGLTGTSYQIGETTYYNFSNGINGNSYKVGSATYYNFIEPITGNSYNLGTGSSNSINSLSMAPFDSYSSRGVLLYDICKGVDSTKYPDFISRGTQLSADCLSMACPTDGCKSSSEFSNSLSRCLDEGPRMAFEEIEAICIKAKATLLIELAQETDLATIAIPEKPKADSVLTARLRGQILLQVQSHGEAWYINPADSLRYYMPDGSSAYGIMKSFGLGITNSDLSYIPTVSTPQEMLTVSSVCSSNSIANRLRGKILLQVQDHGEAWYIEPRKCMRIYMKDGGAAYQIMRFLGLGITNTDLEKIPSGE